MRIAGLQKLSLLDYPGYTACTVFTPGCNLRCPFCHNASLVIKPGDAQTIAEDTFFEFLEKRQGLLDGVCISGGEPLMQLGLDSFIQLIKDLGFLVKLDTNGSYPAELRRLVQTGLLDYVAMDVKNTPERYPETVGLPNFDYQPIAESIQFLLEGHLPYEFRTTVVKNFHGKTELLTLASALQTAPVYALQGYQDSGDILSYHPHSQAKDGLQVLNGYSETELQAIYDELKPSFPNLLLRA